MGEQLKPLGDAFIKLIKMIIAPVIFCTVVSGIAGMESMKSVGKTGGIALLYFEIVSTIALIIGLVVINIAKPGVGMNIDPATLDTSGISKYVESGASQSTVDFFMHIIPNTVVGAFAEGEILQVLLFALLFGFALHKLGDAGKPVLRLIDQISHVFFNIVNMIMKLAPPMPLVRWHLPLVNMELVVWRNWHNLFCASISPVYCSFSLSWVQSAGSAVLVFLK